MAYTQAITVLEAAGYRYYGCLMMSGLDFDDPKGNRIFLTEKQTIELAESLET